MRLKLHRARELGLSGWTRLELAGYWLLAGFGYRPLWVIGQAVLVVVAYAAIYWGAEGLTLADGRPASSFDEALYFSGITFATVGYGDILPAPHMRIVALSEGAIGIFTLSFFVVVLANRLRH